MNPESPAQFALVEHKESCIFCWLEKRESVHKLSFLGGADEKGIERLISTWVRHNGPKVPIGILYGAFTLTSNIFIFRNPLWLSIAFGAGTTLLVALIRVLVLWVFYRKDTEVFEATLITISKHTYTDIRLVAKWINDTLTELFLWRQLPRGFSLVVSSIYAAITLNFLVAGVLGFLSWFVFGILRYRLWDWGHYRLNTIDFSRQGSYRAELRPLWIHLFHISYFVFLSAKIRWAIGFVCLFIVLYRLGNIVEPGQNVYGYNWYFYFCTSPQMVDRQISK